MKSKLILCQALIYLKFLIFIDGSSNFPTYLGTSGKILSISIAKEDDDDDDDCIEICMPTTGTIYPAPRPKIPSPSKIVPEEIIVEIDQEEEQERVNDELQIDLKNISSSATDTFIPLVATSSEEVDISEDVDTSEDIDTSKAIDISENVHTSRLISTSVPDNTSEPINDSLPIQEQIDENINDDSVIHDEKDDLVDDEIPVSYGEESGNEVLREGDEKEDSSVHATLYPHKVGIRNHALNCYASAVVSCLYNIPVFQEALFSDIQKRLDDPKTNRYHSVSVALATIFFKMRYSTSQAVDLEPFFVPAVQSSTTWVFRGMQCVLHFWDTISEVLPSNVIDLFKVEGIRTYYRRSDMKPIKSKLEDFDTLYVSPNDKYTRIEEFIENKFFDFEAEDYIVEESELQNYEHLFDKPVEGKQRIPSFNTLEVLNAPNILIFGIKRIYWNTVTNTAALNTKPVGFSETLTLHGEDYSIIGNIEYDLAREHYYSHNLDLLSDSWFLHDDRKIELIPDTHETMEQFSDNFAKKSCMVFYIKTSLIKDYIKDDAITSRVDIPAEVIAKLTAQHKKEAKLGQLHKEANRKLSKRKRVPEVTVEKKASLEVSNDESRFGRRRKAKVPLYSEFLESKSSKAKESTTNTKTTKKRSKVAAEDVEVEEKEQVSVPIEIVHVPMKILQTAEGEIADFRLKVKTCSFKREGGNPILEHIIVSISSNPAAVQAIFKEAATKTQAHFIYHLAKIILKILLGHWDISTAALTQELMETKGFEFTDITDTWMSFSQLLPLSIAPIPDIKTIKYLNDEPVQLNAVDKCDFIRIRPWYLKPCPININVNGVFFDSHDSKVPDVTRRTVFKSDGIITPVGIMRIWKTNEIVAGKYFDHQVILNSHKLQVYSFIGYDPYQKIVYSIHWSPYELQNLVLFYKNVPRNLLATPKLLENIGVGARIHSELILLSSEESLMVEMPLLSEVPANLLDEFQIIITSKWTTE